MMTLLLHQQLFLQKVLRSVLFHFISILNSLHSSVSDLKFICVTFSIYRYRRQKARTEQFRWSLGSVFNLNRCGCSKQSNAFIIRISDKSSIRFFKHCPTQFHLDILLRSSKRSSFRCSKVLNHNSSISNRTNKW